MKEKYYFESFPVLEDERLLLREITDEEANLVIDLVAYDGFFPTTDEDVIYILDKIRNDYRNGDSVSWGIYLKSTGEIVGTCCYCRGYKDSVGEIGYVLKEKFRGKHIMTEAGKLITDFGLNVMKLLKVSAFTSPDNKASQSVLLRLGFIKVEHDGDDYKFEIVNENHN